MTDQELRKTIDSVLLPRTVERLAHTVGIEKDGVPGRQPRPGDGKARVAEHSDRDTGRGDPLDLPAARDQGRDVPGVADLHLAGPVGATEDERREVARQGALAEQAAGAGDELIERLVERHESAQGGVQVRHRLRGGDPLSGDVADREVEPAVLGAHRVAIVAAHGARPFVMSGDLVPWEGLAGRRQEAAQHPCREIEVPLQRLALRPRQVIEAILHERIGHQAVGLDRLVAGLADAKSTLVHACQGGVHIAQQAADLFIAGNHACGALELLAPFRELIAQEGFNRAGHVSPHALFNTRLGVPTGGTYIRWRGPGPGFDALAPGFPLGENDGSPRHAGAGDSGRNAAGGPMTRAVVLFGAGLMIVSASLVLAAPLMTPESLRRIASDYYRWRDQAYPVASSSQGLHTWDERLADFSAGAVEIGRA